MTTVANYSREQISDFFTRNGDRYDYKNKWLDAQPKMHGVLLSKKWENPRYEIKIHALAMVFS